MGAVLAKLGLAITTVAAAAVVSLTPGPSQARTLADEPAAVVQRHELPPEARGVERRILNGGPFRHAKDGSVFGNRERLLPGARRGYYREYTVRTPGSRDRGARRIVCGGEKPAQPVACYYTDDHYASFRRIVQ